MGIIAYFLIISTVLTGLNKMDSEYSITSDGLSYTTGGLGKSANNLGGCDDPREVGTWRNTCKALVELGSIYDNASCSSFVGCTWTADENWFGVPTGDYVCDGYINSTAYNQNTAFDGEPISQFLGWSESACGLLNLSESESLCSKFGCTWTSNTAKDYIKISKIAGTWGIIKDVFTANINFGTSSTSLNTLLNFIFIVLPIVMLIMAIIMFALG